MDNTFSCDKCNKVFKRKSYLIYHQNKIIPCDKVIESSECIYCNMKLSTKTKTTHHLKKCKMYNEYELKQEIKNNNKELKKLNKKIIEIEDKFEDKIEEQNNKNTTIYDKIKISKVDRIKYLKSNLNIYELVVEEFIKTYYVNENKPENHLLYITDTSRNKIKYYDGVKWIDGDKNRVLRLVMRNCIIEILKIDKDDEEENELINDIWKNTSDNAIDLLYLRSTFSLVDDEGKIKFKGLYNSILNIMTTAIYNGKNMISKSIVNDNNINKKIISKEADVKKLKNDKKNNKNKIVELKNDKKQKLNY